MIKPIPKWTMQRYSRLWKKFQNKEISYSDIENALKGDGKNTISVFLNELRNSGWIDIKLDETDTRKRKYVLRQPEKIILEIGP